MTYVALVWATREAEVVLMFVGQVGCEALNFVLKRIIKEERPQRTYHTIVQLLETETNAIFCIYIEMNGKGYGMPSSHAQFVVYFAVYLSLFLFFRHVPVQRGSRTTSDLPGRITALFTLCFGSGIVAASRIYLNYHTPKQVLAGCAAGVACAFAWFLVTDFLRTTGWINWILDLRIARHFRIRDLVVSEDLAEAGWQRWEEKRKSKLLGRSSGCKSA